MLRLSDGIKECMSGRFVIACVLHAGLWVTVVCDLSQVEERSKLNKQSSPAQQNKVSNRISNPSLPPRSESFSSCGMQPACTPPIQRSIEPQVCVSMQE